MILAMSRMCALVYQSWSPTSLARSHANIDGFTSGIGFRVSTAQPISPANGVSRCRLFWIRTPAAAHAGCCRLSPGGPAGASSAPHIKDQLQTDFQLFHKLFYERFGHWKLAKMLEKSRCMYDLVGAEIASPKKRAKTCNQKQEDSTQTTCPCCD